MIYALTITSVSIETGVGALENWGTRSRTRRALNVREEKI